MNDKLPTEVRRKVAELCLNLSGTETNVSEWWLPDVSLYHKDALTRTAARLIEGRHGLELTDEGIFYYVLLERLNKALSTDSVDDLERIVAELRGFV